MNIKYIRKDNSKRYNVLIQRLRYFKQTGRLSDAKYLEYMDGVRTITKESRKSRALKEENLYIKKIEAYLESKGITPLRRENYVKGEVVGNHTYTGRRNNKYGGAIFRCNRCGREYTNSNLSYGRLLKISDCGCSKREARQRARDKKEREREESEKLKAYPKNLYNDLSSNAGTIDVDEEDPISYLAENAQTISKQELYVLSERYKSRAKLREVGSVLGVSRERVRQIEKKALAKARPAFLRCGNGDR